MSLRTDAMSNEDGTNPRTPRRMTWPRLSGLLVVFALLPSFIDVFVLSSRPDFTFPDQKSVTDRLITASIGVAITLLVVTWLRWWPVVIHERLRARRWVWIVPGSIFVVSVGLLDYSRAVEAGALLVATLLAATLCIAIGEELLFRGIVLIFLRSRYREGVSAAVSSLLFGLIHFPAGPVQVLFSMAFGYLLYLTRRVSGGLLVPIVVHAAWDFSVFTSFTTANPGTSNASVALAILTLILLISVLIARKRIDPVPAAQA